jgi:hypothetical protein
MSKRTLFEPDHPPLSALSGTVGPPQKSEMLREAYKRHCSELVTIEEQQGKLLLVMLGILSAGATFLAAGIKEHSTPLECEVKVGLTIMTLALLALWGWFTWEKHGYRRAVRDLLVRCEVAMGFYEGGTYLHCTGLYTTEELEFPSPRKGRFVPYVYLLTVGAAGAGFLLILWAH